MFVNIGLKFFSPPGGDLSMRAGLGPAAKLAHDERLLIANVPLGVISVGGRMFIPADVLIGSKHVQGVAQGIVDNFGVAFRTYKQSCRDEAARVQLVSVAH